MHTGEKFVINIAESTKYILIKYQNYDSTEKIAKKICAGESGTSCYDVNNYIGFIEPLAKTFGYFSHDHLLKIAVNV
jgi:hypothetical protein